MISRNPQVLVVEPDPTARFLLRSAIDARTANAGFVDAAPRPAELDGLDVLVIAGAMPDADAIARAASARGAVVVTLHREGDAPVSVGWSLDLPCSFTRVKTFIAIIVRAIADGRRPSQRLSRPVSTAFAATRG